MSPYRKREPDYRKSPSRMKQPESELGRWFGGRTAGWLQGLQTAVASRVRTAWEEAFSVREPHVAKGPGGWGRVQQERPPGEDRTPVCNPAVCLEAWTKSWICLGLGFPVDKKKIITGPYLATTLPGMTHR